MTDEHEETTAGGGSDGLWRWLVGGLVGGAVVLSLLVASYPIGHNRDEYRYAVSEQGGVPGVRPCSPTTAVRRVTP